jgi:hypothetical protein
MPKWYGAFPKWQGTTNKIPEGFQNDVNISFFKGFNLYGTRQWKHRNTMVGGHLISRGLTLENTAKTIVKVTISLMLVYRIHT